MFKLSNTFYDELPEEYYYLETLRSNFETLVRYCKSAAEGYGDIYYVKNKDLPYCYVVVGVTFKEGKVITSIKDLGFKHLMDEVVEVSYLDIPKFFNFVSNGKYEEKDSEDLLKYFEEMTAEEEVLKITSKEVRNIWSKICPVLLHDSGKRIDSESLLYFPKEEFTTEEFSKLCGFIQEHAENCNCFVDDHDSNVYFFEYQNNVYTYMLSVGQGTSHSIFALEAHPDEKVTQQYLEGNVSTLVL